LAGARPEDFASASLVALVVKSVLEADPELLPPGAKAPDPMRGATLSAADKRSLLAHIYRRRGAGPLLAIGRHLDAAASPVLAVLANAARPEIMIGKWTRLERYGHAVNRTGIRLDGNNALACRRWSEGDPPVAAENALIAGFLFGICRLAGAQGLTLAIDGRIVGAGALPSVGALERGGESFRIAWENWKSPVSQRSPPGTAATGERLRTLLAGDIARDWSLAEAASQLAKSPRSLQRELSASGVTFSTTLRGVRIGEAARLLREDGASLAEIGYCCGYADQPHFQRDFRRALNMSPGEYRRVARS
jgi:AraC-like DNA-binding protein